MSRSDDQRLVDIREAAEQLAALVEGGREAFEKDWMRQLAAERLLEIIGEASNAISDMFKAAHPDISWRHVINLRHLLVHHYHRIDPEQVWEIAVHHVPALLDAIAGENPGPVRFYIRTPRRQ